MREVKPGIQRSHRDALIRSSSFGTEPKAPPPPGQDQCGSFCSDPSCAQTSYRPISRRTR